ncbi:hypothetical protein GPALN_011375 [Globodera pallida]|nr:hypothetical protein GPALN_011375 [Globodera pallida]
MSRKFELFLAITLLFMAQPNKRSFVALAELQNHDRMAQIRTLPSVGLQMDPNVFQIGFGKREQQQNVQQPMEAFLLDRNVFRMSFGKRELNAFPIAVKNP